MNALGSMLLAILASSLSYGAPREINFRYDLYRYQIKAGPKKITFEDPFYDLIIQKRKCSKATFERFEQQVLTDLWKGNPWTGCQGYRCFELERNGKRGKLKAEGPYAQRLVALPQQIKRFKVETDLNCRKTAKQSRLSTP